MTIDHMSIVWTGEIYNYEFVPDGEGQEGLCFVLEKPLTNWTAIYMLFGISIGTALGTSFDNIGIGLSLGLCFGISIGAALDSSAKKNAKNFWSNEESTNRNNIGGEEL